MNRKKIVVVGMNKLDGTCPIQSLYHARIFDAENEIKDSRVYENNLAANSQVGYVLVIEFNVAGILTKWLGRDPYGTLSGP